MAQLLEVEGPGELCRAVVKGLGAQLGGPLGGMQPVPEDVVVAVGAERRPTPPDSHCRSTRCALTNPAGITAESLRFCLLVRWIKLESTIDRLEDLDLQLPMGQRRWLASGCRSRQGLVT